MPFLRLYLLRHGQTASYDAITFNGWLDVDLSDLGRRQLDQTVSALKGQRIDAVYSSDLRRAVYGGSALARELGLTLRVEPKFKEINFGLCEGLTYEEMKVKYADVAGRLVRPDGGDFQFPGGEGAEGFRARIREALTALKKSHPEGCVALYCHAGVCRAILAEALGLDNTQMWGLSQDHACLNVIDFFPTGGAMVRLVNGDLGPTGYNRPGPGYDRLTYLAKA
ncbi:MAG: histidine phosphatase family protein [Deltaproteobacteria bacterium]|jgi:broad specificity phosphatase PhoE|nr:histidine phosphatase family protein [Deltaproteobacteria bacterium]